MYRYKPADFPWPKFQPLFALRPRQHTSIPHELSPIYPQSHSSPSSTTLLPQIAPSPSTEIKRQTPKNVYHELNVNKGAPFRT